MNEIKVGVATSADIIYVSQILETIEESAKVRGTGIAKREPSYIIDKITQGKAIIATSGDKFVGFCYVESWGNKQFVANSGLIVRPEFRAHGVAKDIKRAAFNLSREMFPEAQIFGLTLKKPKKNFDSFPPDFFRPSKFRRNAFQFCFLFRNRFPFTAGG